VNKYVAICTKPTWCS